MSPFNNADKIKKPILLVHGEEDSNPGTYPMQSERLYQALKVPVKSVLKFDLFVSGTDSIVSG